MAPPTSVITGLVELWGRLSEPEAQDLVRALRLARLLEADLDATAPLLCLVWGLVEAEHAAAGWEVQPSAHSPRCEAAAEAARRAWAELLEALRAELGRVPGECLVLGLPAASRALFGAWDLLPADGLELVVPGEGGPTRRVGVGAGGAVRVHPTEGLGDLLATFSARVDVGGHAVRVPTAPLLAALAAEGSRTTTDSDTLVFVAAASKVAEERRWSTVEQIAERLGSGRAPRSAAARLGLEDRLGLEKRGAARLTHALKRLLEG